MIQTTKIDCHYEMFAEDCMLAFVISYGQATEYHISVSKTMSTMVNRDLCLFGSDKDWHRPILLHLRSADPWSRNVRRRTASREADRKRQKRRKYKARHENTTSAPEGREPLPPGPVGLI